jgi:hypothetical protein
VLGLASSGAGKDHPRKINSRILQEIGLIRSLGDSFASGEGIEDSLSKTPSMLFQVDEMDSLINSINKSKDASTEKIMTILLKMYSGANAVYCMRVKSGFENETHINQPNLSIFGTAIPKYFYESISSKMLRNGFFARLLILEAGKRERGSDPSTAAISDDIFRIADFWKEYGGSNNLIEMNPAATLIETTEEARDYLNEFRDYADDQISAAEDADDDLTSSLWARANEKARKLALIYACSANHMNPSIDINAANWAREFTLHQTKRMLFMAAEHCVDSDFHSKCNQVLKKLKRWKERNGDKWMQFYQIAKVMNWTMDDHEKVRKALQASEQIEVSMSEGQTRRGYLYRLNTAE